MAFGGGKMPTNAQHTFAQVPSATIQRSSFNRSYSVKTTFDAGMLIPFLVDPIYPGDTFNVRMNGFTRLSPTALKVPIMDNVYLDTFFFFVPLRLLWVNFVKFMGEQANPGDSVSFVIPTLTVPFTPVSGDMADYFGLPIGPIYASPVKISALPFRAYNLIWNQWFRDENLQASTTFTNADGPDSYAAYPLKRRGKRHDYFTSCLPFLQKGPAVLIPLGQSANVNAGVGVGNNVPFLADPATPSVGGNILAGAPSGSVNPLKINFATDPADNTQLVWRTGFQGLVADLSTASAATVNDLRQAWQVQRLYERDARGGTRYTEIVRSHFKVVSPDARLQRAEYLGGGSSPVFVNPVAQTAPQQAAGVTTPQGNLAGVGTASFQGHGFVKSFTEHGLLIGLMSVRADMNYFQGIERWWTDQTKLDFYWPVLANLGEQAVFNREIFFAGGGAPADDGVFGYQERYGHLRYKPGRITGKMRSDVAGSLDVWHLAQDHAALPTLNSTFIEENPPIARVIAVTTEPHFLFDGFVTMKCARPMPLFGVPGGTDHF